MNPYAHLLDFPASLMRSRRDHERFVDLIAAVCFLRQYQKEEGTSAHYSTSYIECDKEDYTVAYRIMKGILRSTLTSLPRSAILLYDHLKKIVREKAERDDLSPNDIWVTQREIREISGLSHDMVKRNIRMLCEYEYVTSRGSTRGMTRRYGLKDGGDPDLYRGDNLLSPEQLPEQPGQRGAEKEKRGKSNPSKEIEESGASGVVEELLFNSTLGMDLEESGAPL